MEATHLLIWYLTFQPCNQMPHCATRVLFLIPADLFWSCKGSALLFCFSMLLWLPFAQSWTACLSVVCLAALCAWYQKAASGYAVTELVSEREQQLHALPSDLPGDISCQLMFFFFLSAAFTFFVPSLPSLLSLFLWTVVRLCDSYQTDGKRTVQPTIWTCWCRFKNSFR